MAEEMPPPAYVYDSLRRFDWRSESDRRLAFAYRKAEVPFIVSNIPVIEESVEKWSDLEYLKGKLTKRSYLAEYSNDNHFMYFSGSRGPKGWKPPVENRQMSFPKWLEFSAKFEEQNFGSGGDTAGGGHRGLGGTSNGSASALTASSAAVAAAPHYYFRTNSMESGFVAKDLSVLTPSGDKDSLFIVDTHGAKGRFGGWVGRINKQTTFSAKLLF